MTRPIISVENLGKRYVIQHESNVRAGRYRRFSEEIVSAAKKSLSFLRPGNRSGSEVAKTEEFWALRSVSLEVQQGEILGIIGRNGAGKSTLLKVLSRITEPTEGRVRLRGRVASLLEVGTGFHLELTGRENIFLNGAILGMKRSEIRRKFDEIVEFSGVEKFLDTPVKRYSSGMYVRLAFAVAAHLEPDILIVDEVLAVGDAAFQKKSLGKMEDVSRSGRTVFLVSHNMATIKRLSSSVLHLRAGSVVARGPADDVIRAYIEEDVARTSAVDVPEAMHRVTSPFRIKRVELVGESGSLTHVFRRGESIRIRLTTVSSEAVGEVRVGIALAVGGVRVATMHTQPLNIRAGSQQEITCTIPRDVLLPNVYDLEVGVHEQASGRGLDWIPGLSTFEVLLVPRDGLVVDEKELGVVHIEPRWEVTSKQNPSGITG